MPDTPVAESIMADILTALQGITTGNGYWNTFNKVARSPESPLDELNLPLLAVFEAGSALSQHTVAQQKEVLSVQVDGWKNVTSDVGTEAIKMRQDIERAIMTDPRRGGNALKTEPTAVEIDYVQQESHALVGVSVRFAVTFAYTRGQP